MPPIDPTVQGQTLGLAWQAAARRRTLGLLLLVGLMDLGEAATLPAQTPSGVAAGKDETSAGNPFVNFAYAAQLGVGRYSVDQLTATTLKIPIKKAIRRSSDQRWGFSIKAPVTFGRYDADAAGIGLVARADAVSIIPGVEFSLPMSLNWRLRPFVDAGFGRDLDSGRDAVLLSAGAYSRVQWHLGHQTLSLGNSLIWAANLSIESGGASLDYGSINTGLDLELSPEVSLLDRRNRFSVYAMHMRFAPRLRFTRLSSQQPTSVDLWETGLTFGSDDPIKVLGFVPLRRIAIGYRFGDGFRGVRLSTGFPF